MNHQIIDANKIARRLVGNYLAVKPEEEVFIVVDPETDMTMPLAIASAAQECGAEYTLASTPTRRTEKATTCTDVIAKGMEAADVYISMTRASVSVDNGDPRIVTRIIQLIDTVENADNIAEIGLGLNPASLLNGGFQEEKKARGTCHIAMGDDLYYDGNHKCDVHLDMIMYKPTALIDKIVVVDTGTLMMENLP